MTLIKVSNCKLNNNQRKIIQNITLPKLTRSIRISIIITLILFCASALAHGPVKKSTKSRFYTEFEYEYIADKIIIPVQIENNTYRFVFDTDVPSVISDRVLKKINIEDKKSIELKTGNNANISLDLVTLPTIQIEGGGFQKYNFSGGSQSYWFTYQLFKC
ncbi:MAG: hypothetical protein L3J83_01370 [Proteobacteria bacterium]|nr:hypothetical protein [Pseudomonadota bacterium]